MKKLFFLVTVLLASSVYAATTIHESMIPSITLSKMATGTTGNLITYNGSGVASAVSTGSAGQVLVSNGSGNTPTFQAFATAETIVANSDSGSASTISYLSNTAEVTGITTDANDWIVLPAITAVPVGHTLKVVCNAGSNFEIRTPASSNTPINTLDADGSNEYLAVDAEVVVLTKVSDTDGWSAYDIPALGGVGTATVPDP